MDSNSVTLARIRKKLLKEKTKIRRKTRRKRLVIGGIPLNDHRRYEAAKRWCESFGEIGSIVRRTNGDILVDFKKAEVADTVCRVQARVSIAGVGSCSLSWHVVK